MLFFGLVLKPGESRSCSVLSYLFVENKSFFSRGGNFKSQESSSRVSFNRKNRATRAGIQKNTKVEKKEVSNKKIIGGV